MKTKFFALIIAVLCLSVIFVACNDKACETHVDDNSDGVCDVCESKIEAPADGNTEEPTEAPTEAPCETHKDADADKICDACKKAIVSITVQVPAEQETAVDMVVNKIPEKVTITDYIETSIPTAPTYTKTEEIIEHNGSFAIAANKYIVVTARREVPKDGGGVDVYINKKIIDCESNKVIYETGEYEYNSNRSITIQTYDDYFTVQITDNGSFSPTAIEFKIFTYDDTKNTLGKAYKWSSESEEAFAIPTIDIDSVSDYRYTYLTYDGITYAIDTETDALLASGDEATFVKRPNSFTVIGKYGYHREDSRTIHVYDLDKWLSCIYAYEIPASAVEGGMFLLANGNILVQYMESLPDLSASYDVIVNGKKYDIVYEIIDIEKKTETEIEFGYLIKEIYKPLAENDRDVYTDKVENILTVYPIKNDMIYFNEEINLVVDNSLSILCDITEFNNATVIADGKYTIPACFENTYGEISELIDIDGNHLSYLDRSYSSKEYLYGIQMFNGDIYDYNGKLILDEGTTNDVTTNIIYNNSVYAIYSTTEIIEGVYTTKYFFLNYGSDAIEIGAAFNAWNIVDVSDVGYLVSYISEESSTIVYELYNNNNKLIMSSENYINTYIFGETVVVETNSTLYILK